jgi:hypothetical protein
MRSASAPPRRSQTPTFQLQDWVLEPDGGACQMRPAGAPGGERRALWAATTPGGDVTARRALQPRAINSLVGGIVISDRGGTATAISIPTSAKSVAHKVRLPPSRRRPWQAEADVLRATPGRRHSALGTRTRQKSKLPGPDRRPRSAISLAPNVTAIHTDHQRLPSQGQPHRLIPAARLRRKPGRSRVLSALGVVGVVDRARSQPGFGDWPPRPTGG